MSNLTITLCDGRVFPVYEGQPLSWVLDNSFGEEQRGFPKAKAVIRAMRVHRPEQLERERREMLKSSFDRMFGQNARKMLDLIEQELRPQELSPVHTQDSDCDVDPETMLCRVCGVLHDTEPCPSCGSSGFHKPGCKPHAQRGEVEGWITNI